MSLKNNKNPVIIGAVVVGLLAGTVLLGNYTNILSARSNTDSQPAICPAKASSCCPAAMACSAEIATVENSLMANSEAVAKTCPYDSSTPCCAEKGICPKTDCPPDCTKPCCEGCPKTNAAADSGCCPAIDNTTE